MLAIEETFFFLIDFAARQKIKDDDLIAVLNRTSDNGTTVFSRASTFSEKICEYLLSKNVKVNSVNDQFLTPSMRVRAEVSTCF